MPTVKANLNFAEQKNYTVKDIESHFDEAECCSRNTNEKLKVLVTEFYFCLPPLALTLRVVKTMKNKTPS